MLEKPDVKDEQIIACLQAEYGLRAAQITFLPLGADQNTAVYRVTIEAGTPYFLKLRSGVSDETAVILPRFLADQGLAQIIAPLETRSGRLWAELDSFKLILYPFVEGRNGFEVELSEAQWLDFGRALKRVHTAVLPIELKSRIQRETYAPVGREIVKAFLERIQVETFEDPLAVKLAAFLNFKRSNVLGLVRRAERLAQVLQVGSPEFVLCHSDVHEGNVLIDAGDRLYIVDWDNPILAPKERDLMFIGAGIGGWTKPEHEALFYKGYGETQVDPAALAYYRYERIVQDLAVYCQQLLLSNAGGADREQSLEYLLSNFLPDGTIAIAYRSDRTLRET
ncbi:MAG TPA: phosphotransferase [Anaerolineales bacterium]|jgi:spectinomycin phosphotransferase